MVSAPRARLMIGLLGLTAIVGPPASLGSDLEVSDLATRGATTARLKLRHSPSLRAPVARTLLAGERFEILSDEGSWLRVRTAATDGWISAGFAQLRGERAVTTDRVNLRIGPGEDQLRVEVLDPHRELPVLEQRDEWLRVSVAGLEGWVHGDYVEVEEPAPTVLASGPGDLPPSAAPALPESEIILPAAELDEESVDLPATAPLSVAPAAAAAGAAPSTAGPEPPKLRPGILACYLNQQRVSEGVPVLRSEDGLLFPENVLRDFRVRQELLPPAIAVDGRGYTSLDGVADLLYWVDEARQELWIEVMPHHFETTVVDVASSRYVKPERPPLGGFAHYEANATRLAGGGSVASGEVELGLFSRWGTISSKVVTRQSEMVSEIVRLASTWTIDLPDRRESVRIGDSLARSGSWWQSAYVGGVSWSSNFSTQPGFVPYALPSIRGEATLPSEFELYLGEVLRLREAVPSGPFEIYNLPVVNGDGQFRAVIRDRLGRETVVHQDFYVSPVLLRAGLREFDYNLGWVREEFGAESSAYGNPALVASERYGVTDRFTIEGHLEVLERSQVLGLGGSLALGRLGIGHLTMAKASGPGGNATLWQYGLDRQGRRASFGFQAQHATPGFVRLGIGPGLEAPRTSLRARTSFSMGRAGSLSFSYARRDLADRPGFETITMSVGSQITPKLYMSVSALSSFEPRDEHTLAFTVTRFLGPGRSVGARVAGGSDGGERVGLRYHKATSRGEGSGYFVSAESGSTQRANAAFEVNTEPGTLIVEGVSQDGEGGLRATWRGSLIGIGRSIHAARWSNRSFGLVDTHGVAGVRVYHQNHLIGRTNERGLAVIPGMLPFQANNIRINKDDLPFGARLASVETLVSPFARSGVVVEFPVELTRSALVTLVQDDGEPVPSGATVQLLRTGAEFPVAYKGQVYVTNIGEREELEAVWAGGVCRFTLELPAEELLEARPAPILCRSTS